MAKRNAFQVRNQWPTGFEAVLKLKPTEAINDGWTFVMWSDDHSGLGYIHVILIGLTYLKIVNQYVEIIRTGFSTIMCFYDEMT